MSVVQECALVENAIRRARSLVSLQGSPAQVVGDTDIAGAATSVRITIGMTDGSSGVLVAAHRNFAVDSATSLAAIGRTESHLQARIATAAAVTQTGARRLDVIAGQTHATRRAAGATSPTAERVILTVLRSQLSRATEVLDSVSRQSAELGAHVQGLDYEFASAPPLLEQPIPESPIVWCLRPNGTFGRYRCSILYPDLRVSTYWSPTDDTHG
jgi:hypothetical protein